MNELPRPKVIEGQMAHIEQREWGWFAKVKTPNSSDFRGGLFLSNDGTISLSGYLIYSDPDVKKLFIEAVASLSARGIDLPPPDLKFQTLENLLSNVVAKEQLDLNNEKINMGDTLVICNRSLANQPTNGNHVLYIGKVEDLKLDPFAIGLSSINPENYVSPQLKPAWRVDYEHYTPEDQHLVGVYDWYYRFPVILRHSDTGVWKPDIYRIDDTLFKEFSREAALLAIAQREHPEIQRRGFVF